MVWHAHAPELWRRTTIAIRRQLAKTAGAGKVRLSYAKVAAFHAENAKLRGATGAWVAPLAIV